MPIQPGGIAAEGEGVEVDGEGAGGREQQRRQAADPALQQATLAGTGGAIRVVGGERLLGEDVQPGEEARGLVEVEVVDMAAPLLVEELQRPPGEEGGGSGGRVRA